MKKETCNAEIYSSCYSYFPNFILTTLSKTELTVIFAGCFSNLQQLCLSHPHVIQYLGLPKKNAPAVASNNGKRGYSGAADILILTKQGEIPAQSLSPEELVSVSGSLI